MQYNWRPAHWALLLSFAVVCYTFLPGFYSPDTTGWFDTSGPFFGIGQPWGIYAIAKLLAYVWPSHGMLVLFNQLLIFAGLALLFRGLKFSNAIGFVAATAIVLVNPWTLLTFVAWRDFTGLGLFLCMTGILVLQWQQDSKRAKRTMFFISIVLGFLGCTVLQQFLPVLMLIWGVAIFDLMGWRTGHASLKARLLGASVGSTLLVGCVAGLYYVIDGYVIERDQATYFQSTANYELAHLSLVTGEVLIPKDIYPNQDLEELRQLLDRPNANAYFFSLLFRNKDKSPFTVLTNEEYRQYRQFRKATISNHWLAFLRFRIDEYTNRLGNPGNVPYWRLQVYEGYGPTFDMHRLESQPHAAILKWAQKRYKANQTWITVPPIVFIAIAAVVFAVGWGIDRISGVHKLAIGVLLSVGLIHYLLVCALVYHAEYRWMIFSYYTAWVAMILSLACIVGGTGSARRDDHVCLPNT